MFDLSKFVAGLQGPARQQIEDAAVQAVTEYGAHVIGDAQEYCPIETGALAASGTSGEAYVEGDQVKVELGFNTNYAAIRHEGQPEDQPPRINPKGQSKFLERALRENAPKFSAFVQGRIAAATGGAGGQ